MKKIFIALLLIVALTCVGGFIFVKYIKNKIVDNINGWSSDACQVSYQDISLESFSFPMRFHFKVHEPQQRCGVQDIPDLNTKFEEALIEFNLLDNYLNIDFPKGMQFLIDDYFTSCTSLNRVNFIFTQNIFSLLKSGQWLESLQQISYPRGSLSCESGGQVIKTDFGLLVKIWGVEPEGKTISVALDSGVSDLLLNIDGSVHIMSNKIIGSSINVKNISLVGPGYAVTLQGDLLLAHKELPYFRGKLTMNFDGYPELIDHIRQLSGEEFDKEKSEEFLQWVKNIANFVDDKRITIILRDEARELYFGKQPLSEILAHLV